MSCWLTCPYQLYSSIVTVVPNLQKSHSRTTKSQTEKPWCFLSSQHICGNSQFSLLVWKCCCQDLGASGTHGLSSVGTHTTLIPLLNFGTPRAYDLLIMNLNPLFWVNELKEIGQRMKAAGPINSILWCITRAHHSSRPLCAFCLYPLCYSLIILSRVRVRVANCADHPSLRMAKDLPNADTPPDCAQPPWIMPIIPILWFFFLNPFIIVSVFILFSNTFSQVNVIGVYQKKQVANVKCFRWGILSL